jgi:hypothetical protein
MCTTGERDPAWLLPTGWVMCWWLCWWCVCRGEGGGCLLQRCGRCCVVCSGRCAAALHPCSTHPGCQLCMHAMHMRRTEPSSYRLIHWLHRHCMRSPAPCCLLPAALLLLPADPSSAASSPLRSAVPFGGFNESGVGREKGEYALHNYTQVKSVYMPLEAPAWR